VKRKLSNNLESYSALRQRLIVINDVEACGEMSMSVGGSAMATDAAAKSAANWHRLAWRGAGFGMAAAAASASRGNRWQ